MARRATITDVALAAGVSVSTVSKVINGRYGIAVATSTRVREVVRELNFEPSLVARSMRSHRTHVIGVLVAEFEPFSAEILKGTAAALADTDYELLAYTGSRQSRGAGWERRSLSRLSGTLIDGALIVTPSVVDADPGVPLVSIDPHAGPAGLPMVDSDSFTGAFLATTHLIELGHRRIGFMAGRADLESARLREAGFRHALAEAGIAADPELIRVGDYRRDSVRAPAAALLSLPDRPTAIFAANDLSAMGTMDVARELGLDVPGDLSVAGFDDVPESSRTTPPLTTVHQPLQEMGAAGITMLLALMDGTPVEQTHIRLPTSLVVRGSTSPPR
ncbi:LacI family DNA-binding transcriptional regulator [Pengzhenrongella sicca]|uniref:LacI family DNA-binding transcriptional regulator n=1 Tax=Pengzhenrongella sicca TaxID=2819238 RepID=A0A8A4ZHY1_9MICO|nr:LacI family DNA-binding transcriptional regulator [Pengzhenrongella sicca]QTE30127.1 LacI family DNA-binding transcriptional regulator [Pengzhenrongella sicca]